MLGVELNIDTVGKGELDTIILKLVDTE